MIITLSSITVEGKPSMPRKADVIVTELFDTPFIGEGAIPIIRSALKDCCVKGAKVVPCSGSVYCQVGGGLFGFIRFSTLFDVFTCFV